MDHGSSSQLKGVTAFCDEGSYTLSHTYDQFLPHHFTTLARTRRRIEQTSSDEGKIRDRNINVNNYCQVEFKVIFLSGSWIAKYASCLGG